MRMVIILLASLVVSLSAADHFYEERKNTWFFGVEEPLPSDENETEASTEALQEEREMGDEEYIASIPWDHLDTLSAKEFSAMIDKTKQIAVVKPTVENTSAYIRLQKYATDQSSRFMDAWRLAIIQDPLLTDSHAVTKAERDRGLSTKVAERNALFKKMSAYTTIVMFYSEADMKSAKAMLLPLKRFKERHNIPFNTISVENNPDYIKNLGLVRFPELWYYTEEAGVSAWRRFGTGVLSLSQMEENMEFVHLKTENKAKE